MPDRRHERLRDLFARSLELPVAARGAFLAAACGGDDALRRRLLAMLAGADDEHFLSAPSGALPSSAERPAT